MENTKAFFKVIEGGPLEVSGSFRVVNTQGRIIENKEPVYLCRCGGSSNKPFCDGTHNRNGFSS
ncbi:MAG: CDGSH iron-sulfur domain-containing protein [Bacteroidota bacterium]